MSSQDARAFDSVMLDVMTALMAFPDIGVADSEDSSRIAPRQPRYDRIPRLRPNILALDELLRAASGQLIGIGLQSSLSCAQEHFEDAGSLADRLAHGFCKRTAGRGGGRSRETPLTQRFR